MLIDDIRLYKLEFTMFLIKYAIIYENKIIIR